MVMAKRTPVDPRLSTPLTSAPSVRVQCDDCGHMGYLDADRLADLSEAGCVTFGDLGRRLKCHDCYAAGGLGKSISLEMIGADLKRTASRR